MPGGMTGHCPIERGPEHDPDRQEHGRDYAKCPPGVPKAEPAPLAGTLALLASSANPAVVPAGSEVGGRADAGRSASRREPRKVSEEEADERCGELSRAGEAARESSNGDHVGEHEGEPRTHPAASFAPPSGPVKSSARSGPSRSRLQAAASDLPSGSGTVSTPALELPSR